MSMTAQGLAVPTLEFTTQARCVAAEQQIKTQTKAQKFGFMSFCVKIEK